MITSKTVFVVGAGASAEVGLPVGNQLKTQIAQKLAVDTGSYQPSFQNHAIQQVLQVRCASRPQEMLNHVGNAQVITKAMPLALSIDNFLDAHKDNPDLVWIGKLGIAASILDAEASSLMNVDTSNVYNTIPFSELDDTWYQVLWYRLSAGLDRQTVGRIFENVAFIIFNYDRCLEHFLFEALKTYFKISPEAASEIMMTLTVFHPYGSIGSLRYSKGQTSVDFGSDASAQQLIIMATKIRTFTEGVEDKKGNDQFQAALDDAKRLVFLGFAFHEINMAFFRSESPRFIPTILGTRLGMSEEDSRVVINLLKAALAGTNTEVIGQAIANRALVNQQIITLVSAKCAELLGIYGRTIGG